MHLADAAEVRVQQQTAAKTKLSSQISDLLTRTTPVITSGAGRYASAFLQTEDPSLLPWLLTAASVSLPSPPPTQVTVHVCHEGGAGSDMRVSTGTGQKGRTDSSAVGRGGALDPGGVWTLPHEHHQLCGESQGRLLPLTARLSTGSPPPHCIPSQLWAGVGGGRESWVTLRRVTDPAPGFPVPEARWEPPVVRRPECRLGRTGSSWNERQVPSLFRL